MIVALGMGVHVGVLVIVGGRAVIVPCTAVWMASCIAIVVAPKFGV